MASALTAAALAVVALLGWALDVPILSRWIPGVPSFKANTALAVFCGALSLGVYARSGSEVGAGRRLSQLLALVPLTIGLWSLVEYVTGYNLSIDQLLTSDAYTPLALHPGRPSILSCIALSSGAIALLLGPGTKHRVLFQTGALGLAVTSWLGLTLLAFYLRPGELAAPGQARTISVPAALALLAFAYGTLSLRPQAGLMQLLFSDTLVGLSARRLIPVSMVLPGMLGILYLGVAGHWFVREFGLAIFTTTTVVGYVLLAFLNARGLLRLERVRTEAADQTREALERVRPTADRLQLATQAARIGIWEWDLKTNVLSWEPIMYEIYGLAPGTFSGKLESWEAMLVEEDVPGIHEEVRAAVAAEREVCTQFRIRRPDGAVRTLQGRAIFQRDQHGEPVRVLGADLDVTAQQEAEAQLRESEHRFRAIADSALEFMGLLRPDGSVLEANRTALDFAGLRREDVLGKPFWETRWWDTTEEDRVELRQAIQRAARGEDVRMRTSHRARDGSLATVDFSLKPIMDERGKVVLLFPEGRDVTEMEKARAALAESEERFRTAMEHAAVGMALVDLDGRFLKVNCALCEIVGYSEAELVSLTFQQITHPEDLAKDMALAQQLAEGRISHYHLEKRYLHKDGHIVWVLLSGTLVRGASGEPRMFVAQIQDITERKAHEARLRETIVEKEVLLREIHHRVKNNLQVVSSILRLQARQASSEQVRSSFQDAQARIHTIALVHDKLYQSKTLAAIDFAEHLRELAAMLVRTFVRPPLRVHLDLALEAVSLHLDLAIPLGLIANELVTNALKHAFPERAEGRVAVGLRHAGDALELTVADDGIGIPRGTQFDAGTSLGMHLIESLVQQLRGTLTIEPVSRGSRVTVTIPMDLAR